MEEKPNALWRVLSCLPYLVPLMSGLAFGSELYERFPLFNILILVFGPLLQAYYGNPVTPFIVFFALFLIVVRSTKLPHFTRFNALQSILLDICAMLGGLIIQYLPFEIQYSWMGSLCNMLVFITSTGAVFYSVFFALQGKYPDIPTISEAVYAQVQR
ncbi:Protein TIC 20-II, chloroplastic [Cymbomonas tetramitiformis]|uniref:Protein TIC 20 n=1 Tax=Cymbomonas tetramitiformis TaxID=36881 RepID=A0AAE0LAM4_9CHLO|nr:Protein TIC 20-II, chloroplastic [Cymbomonas tetramitiformis]